MDMVKCKKCGFEIAQSVEVCHVCGKKRARKNNENIMMISAVAALALLVGFFWRFFNMHMRRINDTLIFFSAMLPVIGIIGFGTIKGSLNSRKEAYRRYDNQWNFRDLGQSHHNRRYWRKNWESLNSAQRKVLQEAKREKTLKMIGSLIAIIMVLIVLFWMAMSIAISY